MNLAIYLIKYGEQMGKEMERERFCVLITNECTLAKVNSDGENIQTENVKYFPKDMAKCFNGFYFCISLVLATFCAYFGEPYCR